MPYKLDAVRAGYVVNKQLLINDDCVRWMQRHEPNSIDAVVTDPPYGLEFMGSEWDTFAVRLPREVLNARRFAHLSTVERLRREDVTHKAQLTLLVYQEWTRQWALEAYRILKPGAYMLVMSGTRTMHRMICGLEDAGFIIRDCLCWVYATGFPKSYDISKGFDKRAGAERVDLGPHPTVSGKGKQVWIAEGRGTGATGARLTAPTTELAHQWHGWGTALKPAWEPIVMVQKPLEGTYCENVERWGCGGLNIEGCRVSTSDETRRIKSGWQDEGYVGGQYDPSKYNAFDARPQQGRFPANVQVDSEPEGLLDDYSRFFIIPKPSPAEREAGNKHPTVKPIRLMKQLIKLVTPPGGMVVDLFVGSGTACLAAKELDIACTGIEKGKEYYNIAVKRLG